MSGLISWDDEFSEANQKIKDIHTSFDRLRQDQQQESDELLKLQEEVISLAKAIGVSEESIEKILDSNIEPYSRPNRLEWDDEFLCKYNSSILETDVREEVFRNPCTIPSLSNLDYTIVGIAGLVANILDFLVVKIPKDINYLGKFKQEGSNFTHWLKTLGIDEEGELSPFLKWCEDTCKVSYDQSINSNIKGFNPRSHRLLSLGHDPLFGLIFGTLDILNGTMTAFDSNGKLHIVKTFDMPLADKAFAPLIWLGHIVSDMCTKMGVPIPGWAFLQLIQFGSFGSDKKTIADISRWMYLNGYDLRHFVTMSLPVAVIELIVRAYHYLSSLDNPEQLQTSPYTSITIKELHQIKSKLKLRKMLLLAHAVAATGNAVKLFTYSGNPLAINLPQWIFLIKESVKMIQAVNRDTTPEKIIRNREKINNVWQEIKNIHLE
ncbi:hypothetical protein NIES2100_04740 [Calothrix sp. NIES-2100]|uniref:hypothetical protein n=1 Tax=Calothrix sp. NIES-2100 TaxID=1954172 RepID=UPI000B5E7F44|nr:hypothetical protein NIES2100_04740 [Calothrix sp. NIES-2100]